MANTKSALKALRQSERRRLRNKPVRSACKTYIRRAERLIAGHQVDEAQKAIVEAVSTLDKAASKGVIHRGNAARRKSRLMKKLNAVLQVQAAQ